MTTPAPTELVYGLAGLTMELAQIAGIENAMLAMVLAVASVAHHAWRRWSVKSRKKGMCQGK